MGFVVLGAVVVLLIGFWAVLARGRIKRLRANAEALWDQIHALLKRRWDLVPTLVTEANRHVPIPDGAVDRIERARENALEAKSLPEIAEAEHALKDALFPLFAIVEQHRASHDMPSFSSMGETLEETEDEIQRIRSRYNDVIHDLNRAVTTFPRSMIARMLGFGLCDYYDLPDHEQEALRGYS
jgi:LemA protein